jgi:hypothetical protein
MKLFRSWPGRVPEGRNYVVDGIEKLIIDNFTYEKLFDVDDDIVMLEWDIAIDPEDLDRFTTAARADPDDVRVAPYRLRRPPPRSTVWVHRYDTNRHVQEGDPFCHWFGLGLTYIPKGILAAFKSDLDKHRWAEGFNDCTLSMWHWRVTQKEVPIMWDVRPAHLHYDTPVL